MHLECPYDEIAARWFYWTDFTPEPHAMTIEAHRIVSEAAERLAMFHMMPMPEDVMELAMALADGSEA